MDWLGGCWATCLFAVDAETSVTRRQGFTRAAVPSAVAARTESLAFECDGMTTHCGFKRCEAGRRAECSETDA